jgi:hypothetical protein
VPCSASVRGKGRRNFANLRAETRHQVEGGLMPLSWFGVVTRVRLAPPQGPTGKEFRKVAAIQARALAGGQTRKDLSGTIS